MKQNSKLNPHQIFVLIVGAVFTVIAVSIALMTFENATAFVGLGDVMSITLILAATAFGADWLKDENPGKHPDCEKG